MTPWLDHSEPADREPGEEDPQGIPQLPPLGSTPTQQTDQYARVLNRTSRTVPTPDQWEAILAPERELAEIVLCRMHKKEPKIGWDMLDDQDVLENLATLAAVGRAMRNCDGFCPGLTRCEAKEAGNRSSMIPAQLQLSASPYRATARIDILWGPCKLKRQAALAKKQIQAERHEEAKSDRGYGSGWR